MLIYILIILSSIECNVLLVLGNFSRNNKVTDLNVNTNKKVNRERTLPIINSGMNKDKKDPRVQRIVPDNQDYDYVYEDPTYPDVVITQDPNVDYGQIDSINNINNTSDQGDYSQELVLEKALLNGTIEDVKKLKSSVILNDLPAINRIELSLSKKLAVWEVIKDNQSVTRFGRSDLEAAGNLLLAIPEVDLFNLNYSSWDLIDYLGTLPGISRRKTGVIGYALKTKYGENIIRSASFVNRMKGILCAFSPQELNTITPDEFCLIKREVFRNIRACTTRQLQVLLHIAMISTVYGPTQAWEKNVTDTLALLISSLGIEDLQSIRPEAMEGVDYTTIEAMPREKLLALNEDQISYLNDLSLAALRRVTGIDSNNSRQTLLDLKRAIFVFILCWSFVIMYV